MRLARDVLWILVGLGAGIASAGMGNDPVEPGGSDAAVVRRHEEVVVVSASKSEQALVDAPATLSVISGEAIATAPSTNMGDLLRSIPGTNVVQMSARDVNITSRHASSTLTTSQLALLDGRSLYLDFFGIVLWDFVPQDPSEIKQIEVVRGPASAVWGANALTGVVNIITKTPRESLGTGLSLSAGLFGRNDAGETEAGGPGGQLGASARHARTLGSRFSLKASAGWSTSDAWSRPSGAVPRAHHPLLPERVTGGGVFSAFRNRGTRQPRLDLRLDQEVAGGTLTYGVGYAGTQGIIHSGIGPFDIASGSYMRHARLSFVRGRFKAAAFVNDVKAEAPNLQSVDALSGEPVHLGFKTRTLDLELGHSLVMGRHGLLTVGGNVRRNNFDITIAPGARDRTELGLYGQEEIFVGAFRAALGARVDKFGNLDKLVVSPRLMAMWKPGERHSVRASYNRAFRAPAVLNNYLDLTIKGVDFPFVAVCLVAPDLCAEDPALAAGVLGLGPRSVGSEIARRIQPALSPLREESVTAYEIAYTGTFGPATTVGLAYYLTDTDDNINFVGEPATLAAAGLPPFYSSSNPPLGWPLPVELLDHPALRAALFDRLPATIAYLNVGPVRNMGLELSIERRLAEGVRAALTYSWQADPKALAPAPGRIACPVGELSVPAHHRFGAALRWDRRRLFGSVAADHVGRTYWNDVLPQLGFDGYTEAYTLLSASLGVRLPARPGRETALVLKGTNLLDQEIRQHIFGDVQRVGVAAEVRLRF